MTSTETPNSDVIQLNSADLMRILQSGGINLENMDFMNMDPGLAQQIQQLRQTQQTSDPNLNPAAVRQQRPRPSTSRQPSRGTQAVGPYVEIVEQPKARGLRFRYECEGRSAGSIPGENSTPERKIFPSIKIHNYNGPAVIVVSCVTKDEPYKPHPHNLVGKDCKKGVCTLRIRDTSTVSFPHLGIQCAKKKDVDGNLKMRQDINVDPFQTGFKHRGQNIDLNVVRLCFQVFLPDEQGKITRIVQPVVSQAIHDKKALNDLVICRVDKTSGKSKGGDEVFLLCEKINRDDVRVRFFEEREGQIIWEAFGDFGQNDVHRQYAIVFKTPPYSNQYIQQPVEVEMQLQRSSDLEGSDPIKFTYQPEDPDPDRIMEKRKRKAANLNFLESGGSQVVTQETLKQRLKLKATRTSAANRGKQEPMIKEEAQSPEMPQYSLSNLGAPSTQVSAPLSMPGGASFLGTQPSPIDMNTTITSQASLSGGKIQYNPTTSQPQQPAQIQGQGQLQLQQQLIQMLAANLLMQNNSSNQGLPQAQQAPVQSNPMMQQVHGEQQNPQAEQLKALLQAMTNQNQGQMAAGGQASSPFITSSDPNMQTQNVEMNSLGSFDQTLMDALLNQTGDSPMVSFSSFDTPLPVNAGELNYDPNVGGFETVGGETSGQNSQQAFDETSAAVQNI